MLVLKIFRWPRAAFWSALDLKKRKKLELILNKQNRVFWEGEGKAERRGRPRCRLDGDIKIAVH